MDRLIEGLVEEVRRLHNDFDAERGQGLSWELRQFIRTCAKEIARLRSLRAERALYRPEVLFPGSAAEAWLYRIPCENCRARDLTTLLEEWAVEELLPEERQYLARLAQLPCRSRMICLLTFPKWSCRPDRTVAIGDVEMLFAARGIVPATLGELLCLGPAALKHCDFPQGRYVLVPHGSLVVDETIVLSPYLQRSAGRLYLHFGQRGWPEHTYFVGVELGT